MKKSISRVLIVRLSALGDIINSAIVASFIKQHMQGCRVEWLCDEQFADLLRLSDSIDEVHTVALKRIKKEKKLSLIFKEIASLRSLGAYDLIIDMQGLLKSAIVSRIIGSNIHGFDAESAREGMASHLYSTTSSIAYETNIIKRNCTLIGDGLGIEIGDEDIESKRRLFVPPKSPLLNPYVAIVVGASWASKRYSVEGFAEVCDALAFPCLLIAGDSDEQQMAHSIASLCSNASHYKTASLQDLVAIITHAKLVIGGDTGPTHLAWAQNTPSITLYGPTTPRMMFETSVNLAIESSSTVDILHIDKNDMSIIDIEPKDIIEKAKQLL